MVTPHFNNSFTSLKPLLMLTVFRQVNSNKKKNTNNKNSTHCNSSTLKRGKRSENKIIR